MLCTEQHKIAYELLEVRTGYGLKPIYRTGAAPMGTTEAVKDEARRVLTSAFGEDGKEKRTRVQTLRAAILGEWEEGGQSSRDILAFLDEL